jgi:hypothetical protein
MGTCLLLSCLLRRSITPRQARQCARTYVRSRSRPLAQTNGVRVVRGQSAILQDGNEVAFGSPMQQQNPPEDYRFIYRHLASVEITRIHAHYDMSHELGRGHFPNDDEGDGAQHGQVVGDQDHPRAEAPHLER